MLQVQALSSILPTQQYPDPFPFDYRKLPKTADLPIVNSPLLLSHPSGARRIALVHAHVHRRQRLLPGTVANNFGTPMSSHPKSATVTFHTAYPNRRFARSSDISPRELDGTSASYDAKDYFQPHRPRPATDCFTSSPLIAIHKLDTEVSASGNVATDTKSEGVGSGLLPPQKDTSKYSRNPLGMERVDTGTSPALESATITPENGRFAGVTSRRVHQEDQAPDMSKRRFSINFFKRRPRFSDNTNKEKKPLASLNRPAWLRKLPSTSRSEPPTSLADMPVPPTFIPPGLQRVPTPTDAPTQVKGKLADFFFDLHGLQSTPRRKLNERPGRIWDSDAVLMSMEPGLDLSGDESDEAPEGRRGPNIPPFHFGPVNDAPPGVMTPPDLTPGTESQPGQPSSSTMSWFRMRHSDSSNDYQLTAAALKEADERHKFEWLVPEHLPNSPLCPLHIKYRGPSKGLCYWHGRKSNGYGVALGRDHVSRPPLAGHRSTGSSSGWSTGQWQVPKPEVKKRRLVSLSSP